MKIDKEKIFWWGLSLFLAFILYQILRRILGGSWEVELILLTLTSSLLIVCVHNAREISSLKGEFKEFRRTMSLFRSDFKEFKNKTDRNFERLSHLMKEPS
tara:strand:+ start:1734 stop:2036 length:303 start_codon:yes stop_codon:yes gene_type:complete